jgi:predicted regulator of Ras-like GTPase activity (Roadblock/LC7/MglB family)
MTHSNGTGAHAETGRSRSARLDRILTELVGQVPEIEAASVVSFDGLPMASALPDGMDEDRVAAMSAALLSLGERAAEGLGRGELSQVYVEGENGNVFLVSADDEAVLVAVSSRGAKVGMMLFEIRRAAKALGAVLRVDPDWAQPEPAAEVVPIAPEPLRPVPESGWTDYQPDHPVEHRAEHARALDHPRVVEHSSWADSRGSLPPVSVTTTAAPAPPDASNWS